jgi:xanthine dehydrogenase molybdenum-binding subunit
MQPGSSGKGNKMAEHAENKPWLWRPPVDGYIGRRGLRPKEALDKITGKAVYTSDLYLPGMLYAKVYRSPYAHARIVSMDSSKAENLPGVCAVIRYDDPDIDLHDYFPREIGWYWWRDSILPDTADFFGVRVGAVVVAESEETCDLALKLIGEGIVWEHLPIILDPEEPARPDAPLLHPERNSKSNIWKDAVVLNQGDIEKGFAEADDIIEFYQRKNDDDVWATPEPGCIVAHYKGDELEVWYHGASIGRDIKFGMMPEFRDKAVKFKVHTPHNGAMFGGNQMGYVSQLCRYTVIATKMTGKPVKFVDDYGLAWEGTSYETGAAYYRVGFKKDGTITAIKIVSYQHDGHPLFKMLVNSLKTPNIYLRQIQCYWSKGHESCWKDGAMDCVLVNMVINRMAAHLNMNPIDVQMVNDGVKGHDMAWLDENVKKKYGMPVRDSLKEVIEAGKASFDWDNKWHPPGARKLPNGRMHGVGFYACASWATGVRGSNNPHPGISVAQDGTATIFFRRCDCGQSAPTTYCQIVADETGLRYEDVKIEFKEYFSFDAFYPAGSMGTMINSYGLIWNARAMKRLLLEYALKPMPVASNYPGFEPPPTPSPFKGKTIEELDIRESIIFEKANPENRLPIKTITSAHKYSWLEGGPFFVGITPPEPFKVEEMYEMARQACFVEVEVDTMTGFVEVTKLVHSYDLGQSINPDVNDQQLYGGAYQGISVSATEGIFYDPTTGVKLNDNFLGYPILTINDVGEIKCPTVETHIGFSAYGLFGCSEAGKAATAAALLVPAVYNATGKWVDGTPVTPDLVLKALGKVRV